MQQPLSATLNSALTAASAPPTRVLPQNTAALAAWLKLNPINPEVNALIQAAGEWAWALRDGQQPRWLSILGRSGTGKTHTARNLWRWAQGRLTWQSCGFQQHVVYWPAFIADLRSGDGYAQAREMRRWPVLLLDDIGAERDGSGFATEQLNTLLGARGDRWTLITSNLSLEQLAAIEPRIADRMIRGRNRVVEMTCDSYGLGGGQ